MSDIEVPTFIDPLDSFVKGQKIGDAILVNQQRVKAEAAAKAEAERQAAILDKLQQPGATYDDFQKASMLLPNELGKMIQAAATNMKTEQQKAALIDSTKVYAALRSGSIDIAVDLLNKQAEAEAGSKNDKGSQFAKTLTTLITTNPQGAKAVETLIGYQIAALIAALPGSKDVFEAINKLEADRRINNDVALQQQIDDDLLTKAQTELAWAQAWRARHPTGSGENQEADKVINKAVDDIGTATDAAVRAANLAAAIDKYSPPSGVLAKGWEALKGVTGGQDMATALKQEYTAIRNYDALKRLPPGAASDKDVEIALGAFPDTSASPTYIASYLRGVSKLQNYAAEYNKVKAQWVSAYGSLGTANGDTTIDVGGQEVPIVKGQNFWDATDKLTEPNVAGWNFAPGVAAVTTPDKTAPKSNPYSISAGGKTYSFPDQKSLDAFKKAAGIK